MPGDIALVFFLLGIPNTDVAKDRVSVGTESLASGNRIRLIGSQKGRLCSALHEALRSLNRGPKLNTVAIYPF